MKSLHIVVYVLLIIGGLNWLLVGLFDLNVVAYLGATLARLVYILVGLSAVLEIFTHKKNCKACEKTSAPAPTV
jgi:hypothetical protein